MLCITMEAEPRIVKQYKCHRCCSCRNCQGKAMEGGKKVSVDFVLFCGILLGASAKLVC